MIQGLSPEDSIPGGAEEAGELESRELFLRRMAQAGKAYLEAYRRTAEKWQSYNAVNADDFDKAIRAYYVDPEVIKAVADSVRSGVELFANQNRLLAEADPAALSEVVKELSESEPTQWSIASKVVKALPLIPPEIARAVLEGKLNSFIPTKHDGGESRSDESILARLAAAHPINTASNPSQSAPVRPTP